MMIMQHNLIALELNIFQKNQKINRQQKNTAANNYRIQAEDSIMHGYFCIRFINFILKGKRLLATYVTYTNLFSPNE